VLLLPTTYHRSLFLICYDPWFGPQSFTHKVVGSTPDSATFPIAGCDFPLPGLPPLYLVWVCAGYKW